MGKTILFDLDGTLTDSGEGIINCASIALAHYGIPVPDREAMRVFVGPPLHEMFVKFGIPDEKADQAVEVYRSRYNTIGKFENAPYAGIPELLERLRSEGYTLCIATSKPQGVTEDILNHFDLFKYFHAVCGATEDRSRSTKDKVIGYMLSMVSGNSEFVMVGDTHYDILGAKAHGIPGIGVSWGYGKVSDMVNAGAAAIADTVEQLYDLLTK